MLKYIIKDAGISYYENACVDHCLDPICITLIKYVSRQVKFTMLIDRLGRLQTLWEGRGLQGKKAWGWSHI